MADRICRCLLTLRAPTPSFACLARSLSISDVVMSAGPRVAERSHDAPDRLSLAAPVRRARLGKHRPVVAQGRRLGVVDVGDVLEPRVRELAEGLDDAGRRGRPGTLRSELRLSRTHELRHAPSRLELSEVAVPRAAATTASSRPRRRAPSTPRSRAAGGAADRSRCATSRPTRACRRNGASRRGERQSRPDRSRVRNSSPYTHRTGQNRQRTKSHGQRTMLGERTTQRTKVS